MRVDGAGLGCGRAANWLPLGAARARGLFARRSADQRHLGAGPRRPVLPPGGAPRQRFCRARTDGNSRGRGSSCCWAHSAAPCYFTAGRQMSLRELARGCTVRENQGVASTSEKQAVVGFAEFEPALV